jgi:hypothetical protein
VGVIKSFSSPSPLAPPVKGRGSIMVNFSLFFYHGTGDASSSYNLLKLIIYSVIVTITNEK